MTSQTRNNREVRAQRHHWSTIRNRSMGFMLYKIGNATQKPIAGYEPFTRSDPDALRASLRPGDILLVEGNNRISGVIKYLTQSTWSHAALYVGPMAGRADENGEPHVLVEVDMSVG